MTVMVLKALRTSVFHVEHEVDPLILGFSVPCLLWHRKQFARKAGYVRAKDQSGWETLFMQSQKCAHWVAVWFHVLRLLKAWGWFSFQWA